MAYSTTDTNEGLTLTCYGGDGSVMLAMDLARELVHDKLAGFAIGYIPPCGRADYLSNRLSFDSGLTARSAPSQRRWTPSNQAPFQRFRWVHFPPKFMPGALYKYSATAMYFNDRGGLEPGPSAQVSLQFDSAGSGKLGVGFTRGYLTSQAYATEFHNRVVRPLPKTLLFSTAPFEKQYEWLGFQARKMVFAFLEECLKDDSLSLDMFAYDLDEPDIVRALEILGPRLRAVLDNAPLHRGKALEAKAATLLKRSAGEHNIVQTCFKRFAHDKVLIQNKNGVATKVLTGSANFSVRGLYVQANNVLTFDDPHIARRYQEAFRQAFTDHARFARSPIAAQWFSFQSPDVPPTAVSFAPHSDPNVSLERVADAIRDAGSSVMFAVMELDGGGPVLKALKSMHTAAKVFSYGITQSDKGFRVYKPGQPGVLVPFAALDKQVPEPFAREWRGGPGQVIHHKFVVIDFNDANPVVFTGSSNLAAGGERSNGDNLLEIRDPAVAQAFAIEAVRLVDHYQFRAAMNAASADHPLTLERPGSPTRRKDRWWSPYYDKDDLRCTERVLFSHPDGLTRAAAMTL